MLEDPKSSLSAQPSMHSCFTLDKGFKHKKLHIKTDKKPTSLTLTKLIFLFQSLFHTKTTFNTATSKIFSRFTNTLLD